VRSRRSSADHEARQKLLVTLGFIAAGILAVAVSYYSDHRERLDGLLHAGVAHLGGPDDEALAASVRTSAGA
jgi:hypothetical protein